MAIQALHNALRRQMHGKQASGNSNRCWLYRHYFTCDNHVAFQLGQIPVRYSQRERQALQSTIWASSILIVTHPSGDRPRFPDRARTSRADSRRIGEAFCRAEARTAVQATTAQDR